jgi:glycosyltransferase involved in cell wall biosynthesis
MTKLGLRPYRAGDNPPLGSVPVSVVVLTRDEEVNIARCLASVAWADQVMVVDSGSTDATVPIARSLGADVVEQPWLGFSAQREFALRLPDLRHDWVYFVDADEWVSPQLAVEIAAQLVAPACAAFAHRLRLVFQDTWIRHCGWYGGSWVVRLVDRRYAKYDGSLVGERARVNGLVRRLANDIVDEDHKGLAVWLHKHVRYAALEAQRRGHPISPLARLRRIRTRAPTDTRPLIRSVLRDVIFPSIPAKPTALFIYMYVFGLGLLDGRAGLRFCFYHAWYQSTVGALQAEAKASGDAASPAPHSRAGSQTCLASSAERGTALSARLAPVPVWESWRRTQSSIKRLCTRNSPVAAWWTWRSPSSVAAAHSPTMIPVSASRWPGT